jgi:type VI secretion system protein ImpM
MWDRWLQDCITASQSVLNESWLDKYLVSPMWRFAIPAGVCGQAVYCGVLVPSVDRVGRYFPLTVVAALPAETGCLSILLSARKWFESVESTLLDILEEKVTDLDQIDATICELGRPLTELSAQLAQRHSLHEELDLALLLSDVNQLAHDSSALLETLLDRHIPGATYWLTNGSSDVSARLLVVRGLPPDTRFAAMIGGDFSASDWQVVLLPVAHGCTSPTVSHQISSSVRTDRGHVRNQNEDCATSRPDVRFWAVADGMGGYQNGAVASAQVCDALESANWHGTMQEKIESCSCVLREVNALLRTQSEQQQTQIASATTLVLLMLELNEWVCLWAGDSRLYRLRGTDLEQLSRDHSIGERHSDSAHADEYFVTGGIGVEDELKVEVLSGDLLAGDRFLLCSDGLYEGLDAAAITRCLSLDYPREATMALMKIVLDGPARDNATAVVVYVADDAPQPVSVSAEVG